MTIALADFSHSILRSVSYFVSCIPDGLTSDLLVAPFCCFLSYFLRKLLRDNIAVREPSRFHFNRLALIKLLLDIYLKFEQNERFLDALADDLRSFKGQELEQGIRILNEKFEILKESQMSAFVELLRNVSERQKRKHLEEETAKSVPIEFVCELMGDIMNDPVLLPSSKKIVDRPNIRRHLLSSANDPYTRAPLSEEMLVSQTELKKQIDEWKKRNSAKK